MPTCQIVPTLVDQGTYIASERTFYRVLHEEKMQNHRGRCQEPYKHAKPTSYCATAPNQVWTWNITYLNGPYKGRFYYLYLILDLFSRDVVGWEVYEAAKAAHPERWNGRKVRNWDNIDKVFLNPDEVESVNDATVQQVLKSYPVVAELYAAVKELYAIIYSKHSYERQPWLAKMEKFNIPELQTYINGIRCDIDAVKKGIELQYNNGLAEGSVNKIKVIKRVMYGRNSFELLKAKVLMNEYFYTKFK